MLLIDLHLDGVKRPQHNPAIHLLDSLVSSFVGRNFSLQLRSWFCLCDNITTTADDTISSRKHNRPCQHLPLSLLDTLFAHYQTLNLHRFQMMLELQLAAWYIVFISLNNTRGEISDQFLEGRAWFNCFSEAQSLTRSWQILRTELPRRHFKPISRLMNNFFIFGLLFTFESQLC